MIVYDGTDGLDVSLTVPILTDGSIAATVRTLLTLYASITRAAGQWRGMPLW